MMNKRKVSHESGLTLVEILASLVILGIVFVAFMTIFPQMTLFNSRTETKLETMNEARTELENLKEDGFSRTGSEEISINNQIWWQKESVSEISNDRRIVVEVKQKPDVEPTVEASQNEEIAKELITLHEAIIRVYNGEKVISETFGYVNVRD